MGFNSGFKELIVVWRLEFYAYDFTYLWIPEVYKRVKFAQYLQKIAIRWNVFGIVFSGGLGINGFGS